MPTSEPRCDGCIFYVPRPDITQGPCGECRASAPPPRTDQEQGGHAGLAVWPLVEPADFCGSFKDAW
jgi:hypothetical protein